MPRGIVLIGPPGSGKGTQAAVLAQKTGSTAISAGDLLRAEIASGSERGAGFAARIDAGSYIDEHEMTNILMPYARAAAAAAAGGGYILDGYPRTLSQAEAADALAHEVHGVADTVVVLEVLDDVLIERLSQRGRASGRADDDESVVRNRLMTYAATIAPILDFYRPRAPLMRIDGGAPIEAVTSELLSRLSGDAAKR